MFLLDDVLLAPGKAAFVLFQELARKAQDEWLNDDTIKQELQELNEMLEGGRISERDFEAKECRLLERLEQIARMKFQDKWGPETAVIDAVAEPAAPPPADLPALPAASLQADLSWPAVALSPPPEPASPRADSSWPAVALSPPPEPVFPQTDLSWPAVALSPRPEPAAPVTPAFVAQPPAAEALAPPLEPPPIFATPPPQPQMLTPPSSPPPMPTSAWPSPPPPMPPPVWSPPPAAPPPMPMPAPAAALTMAQIVDCAVRALSMMKMRMSSVTSVVPDESGWRVSVELVERRGIPDTSDLLGLYEVRVDAAGNVLRYERTQMRRRGDFAR